MQQSATVTITITGVTGLVVPATISFTWIIGQVNQTDLSTFISSGVPPYKFSSVGLPMGWALSVGGILSGVMPVGQVNFSVKVDDSGV